MYREQKKYEEYAYVLDFLPHGRSGAPRTPHTQAGTLQLIGDGYFTLLEAAPKKDAEYNVRDRIYVGKDERALIGRIIGRVSYQDLTGGAKAELPSILETIVAEKELYFVSFFNVSQQVTPRMHSLELIPGIGKRLIMGTKLDKNRQIPPSDEQQRKVEMRPGILELRERQPFTSFRDIEQRAGLKNPAKQIAQRVLEELEKEQKYLLFTRPYSEKTGPAPY